MFQFWKDIQTEVNAGIRNHKMKPSMKGAMKMYPTIVRLPAGFLAQPIIAVIISSSKESNCNQNLTASTLPSGTDRVEM